MEVKYYSLKEVSERLKTPIPYLRKLIRKHRLQAHFIGRQYIISEKEIEKFISTSGVKNEGYGYNRFIRSY